jgi:sugar/nucleoside kinase (ribokinase family)
MKTQPRIFGTGLVALDVVFGQENEGKPRYWAGGTCGNVLTILSFLGWAAFPISRLKSDQAFARINEDFVQWGVHCDFLQSSPVAATPIVIERIKKRPDGSLVHRFSFTCPHCGKWLPSYRPIIYSKAQEVASQISEPTVFFLDRVSKGNLHLARECAEKGALIVFEPNSAIDEALESEALSLAHIVKYSSDRAKVPANSPSPLLEIETFGSEGLRYRTNLKRVPDRRWKEMLPISVPGLKDAAGAGDWCTAGLLHRLANGGFSAFEKIGDDELRQGLHFGQVLASWNCRFEGARGGMYKVSRRQFKLEIDALLAGSTVQVLPDEPTIDVTHAFTDLCLGCTTNKILNRTPRQKPK